MLEHNEQYVAKSFDILYSNQFKRLIYVIILMI